MKETRKAYIRKVFTGIDGSSRLETAARTSVRDDCRQEFNNMSGTRIDGPGYGLSSKSLEDGWIRGSRDDRSRPDALELLVGRANDR